MSGCTSEADAGRITIFVVRTPLLYIFYMTRMLTPPAPTSLAVRVGGWFEAHATGWGVLIVPLVLAGLIAAAWLLGRPG